MNQTERRIWSGGRKSERMKERRKMKEGNEENNIHLHCAQMCLVESLQYARKTVTECRGHGKSESWEMMTSLKRLTHMF